MFLLTLSLLTSHIMQSAKCWQKTIKIYYRTKIWRVSFLIAQTVGDQTLLQIIIEYDAGSAGSAGCILINCHKIWLVHMIYCCYLWHFILNENEYDPVILWWKPNLTFSWSYMFHTHMYKMPQNFIFSL